MVVRAFDLHDGRYCGDIHEDAFGADCMTARCHEQCDRTMDVCVSNHSHELLSHEGLEPFLEEGSFRGFFCVFFLAPLAPGREAGKTCIYRKEC